METWWVWERKRKWKREIQPNLQSEKYFHIIKYINVPVVLISNLRKTHSIPFLTFRQFIPRPRARSSSPTHGANSDTMHSACKPFEHVSIHSILNWYFSFVILNSTNPSLSSSPFISCSSPFHIILPICFAHTNLLFFQSHFQFASIHFRIVKWDKIGLA